MSSLVSSFGSRISGFRKGPLIGGLLLLGLVLLIVGAVVAAGAGSNAGSHNAGVALLVIGLLVMVGAAVYGFVLYRRMRSPTALFRSFTSGGAT